MCIYIWLKRKSPVTLRATGSFATSLAATSAQFAFSAFALRFVCILLCFLALVGI